MRCAGVMVALLLWVSSAAARPSSYSASGGGAKALYLLLDDLGYQVSRTFSLTQIDDDTRVLVLLGETPAAEVKRAMEWARTGKLLVAALPLVDDKGLCADASLDSVSIKRTPLHEKPQGTSKDSAGTPAADLKIRPSACAMKLPDGSRLLAGSEEQALAMELTAGNGKLLLLAHEDLLVNANLNRDDLVVLVRRWLSENAPAAGKVLFLESRGGGGGMGLVSMLNRAGLGPFLLHGLIWLLLLYWSKSPRFGDPTPAFSETRREFSQHARALGHLYQRRRASGHVLRQQYERFLDRVIGRPDMVGAGLTPRGAPGASARARMRGNRAAIAALIATRTGRDADSIEGLLAQVEYTMETPGPHDIKDIQRHYRLSQALAALQHTTAGHTSGEKRGRSEIR